MESSSATSTAASSAFHNAEGPKGGATRHANGGGEHTRKQSVSLPDAASGSSTSRGNNSNSNSNHRSSHGSGRPSYQQATSLPQQQSSNSSSSSSRGGGNSSSNNSLPRRNSSTAASSGSGGSSSRDRDRSDRDHRSRGRSKSRDRGSSHHRDRGSSSSSSSSSQYQFGASGNPVVRLRERNNILQMHRTGSRRTNLSQTDVAVRVLGLDTAYMKDPENPHISDKIGTPGVFPTNMNFPEEKFRFHAIRSAAYVNPLPRGFGTNWHLQYSFFTDKKFPVFDEIAQASKVIKQIEDADDEKMQEDPSGAIAAAGAIAQDHVFTSYLIRNVRRIDERTTHMWMCELASGKKSIQELVQSYGVPFKQWRPVPNVSKCPLLECVVRYRPGYVEATWFIRLNVIYTEMNEIKRDCAFRLGDWFYNPRRLQRRSQGWTDQIIDYLHSVARQASKSAKKNENETKALAANAVTSSGLLSPSAASVNKGKSVVLSHRHGDIGMATTGSAAALVTSGMTANSASISSPQLSFHEKWSYVLKLSEYQYKLGLLDSFRYFDGLTSLLQKALSPRSHSGGNCASVISIGVNETMELLTVIQKLLPDLLQCADSTILLVKSVVQHLRYLIPPGTKIPDDLGSSLQEELVVALCQLLRDILLNGYDSLVRMEDGAPSMWPDFVFSDRFFNRDAYGPATIQDCLKRCHQKRKEVSGRVLRLQQSYPSAFNLASMRNEAQVLQTLDRFHRIDASIDLQRVYNEVFVPLPFETTELPVDIAVVFLICEWAVTSQRPAEYRYLSALSLLEMHSNALLTFGKEKHLLKGAEPYSHHVVLQGALQSFLQRYEPKAITEVTPLIDLFCLLVRRRLFSVESFVEFASCCKEVGATSSILATVNSSSPKESSQSSSANVTPTPTAYNIECSPGRGYKSNDIHLLSTTDRLKLYLWQLPRGPFPLPTSIPMYPAERYDGELNFIRWLEVMELQPKHLQYSKTLERAQSLCVYVFHTHGQANDPIDPNSPNNSRVVKEVEYQGKVGELVSAVKTMCGHDKGRFASWFLRNIYEEPTFFRFSDFGSVEHIVRLVCLILEIVDVLALLEVIVYFVRNSPVFLVKNVVIAMMERHEIAFCAAGQIPFLLQAFVDRFHRIPKNADDKAGSLAKFFCKMYYAHAKKKEIGKLDLPFALLRPIAETARKNQDANSQKPKELSLDATNPIVRIPPPREVIPPELKSALSRSFKALQAKLFESGLAGEKPVVNTPTPLQSPDNSQGSVAIPEIAFEAPTYSSLTWNEIVCESTNASETKARDAAVDFAASAINMSMASASVGSTNANATRERRTPNYVFFLRAVLSEVMDKWMANITARIKSNCRRPIMTPHYIHRCVRLIREVVEQHPDGDDFQEKFSNTLVVWLQKEVLPGFCGSETQNKRTRNPFINLENGKEAFLLNQKGRLDKVQYGLKAFLISLIIHKVLDLPQVLRLVLVPLFPRLRRASRDPPPNLPSQLLAMALVFQLFSEPPQNVLMEPQKIVMFDEPLISYQMEDNFLLRKREERGTLASITLFNLTSDGIVRDIIFHDTKEAREKHILPVYHKKQWHTAVLLTHFFRPPNSPAEDANGQVQLLKVDQIIDQMNVWTLNRGGSIYLDLQMSRQQLKVKRTKKTSARQQLKRKAQNDLSSRPSKRHHGDGAGGSDDHLSFSRINGQQEDWFRAQDVDSSDDEEIDFEFDESSSATEILSNLIVLRTLKRSTRPAFLSASSTLCSVSPIATPQLFSIGKKKNHEQLASNSSSKLTVVTTKTLTDVEQWMVSAAREAQEAAVASLYAATVCSISRRAMGSVIAKILQVMEDDVKYNQQDKFARKINGTTVVRLICGIMCTPPGNAFLPRYMMSLAVQLEWLYEGCCQYDQASQSYSLSFLKRLRRKLAIRLQLVAVIGQSKHVALTICYRDRIVKTLFSLLGTSAISSGVGLSLFSWILDLIPLVSASVLHEKEFELVESLGLPDALKRRIWSVFPRTAFGSQPVHVRNANRQGEYSPVDPWGLLEHVPQLPSDSLVPAMGEKVARRRRVFRYV